MRPNIRVEIQNNLVEPMEVEEEEQEEGEIPDEDKDETSNSSSKHSLKSPGDVPFLAKGPASFATGIDLFDKHELEKLQKRAQRFQLKPDEIKNFTDEDLLLLKKSLGITPKNEVNVKPECIMMHGLDEMAPEDILDYFLKYAPVSLEWLNDESCNVVWSDKLTAARALHFMSKPVRGMPVRNGCSYFDGLNEVDGETGESALFKNANREVELQEDMDVTEKPEFEDAVDISEVPGSIPPGYWRLGTKHPKSKCLLLRFSLKTDMQPFKVELLSRYYKSHAKKYGKEEPKHSGIFGRNKAIKRPGTAAEANPWSALAENWDEDVNFRERERVHPPEEEKVEIKSQSLKVRLGSKRKESDDSDSEKEEEVVKRTKIPRMRMYADEEEEKIKKKKMLNTINQTMKKIESDEVDLRRVLSTSNRKPAEVKVEETFDLGTKLKSRRQKMVFEVKTEHPEGDKRRPPKENTRSSRYSARSISPPRYRRSPTRDHRRSRRRSRSRQSRRYDDEDDDYYRGDQDINKPRSKVAVVIKTAKRPTVASAVGSTVWSRINKPSSSSSESESGSKSSSSSSSEEEQSEEEEIEEDEEEEEEVEQVVSSSNRKLFPERPGFRVAARRLEQIKAPLKIEISNDHFNKKRK